jgi:thiol:disulfide interchange protein DsbA
MLKALLVLFSLAFSSMAWAEYDEGIEYEVLKQVQSAPTDGKVEVIEFFSYACPHCYHFEPHILQWKKTKPENVEFIQVPAVFCQQVKEGGQIKERCNKGWESYASLYYAAEVLGVEEQMHPVIFEAIHGDGKKIRNFEDLKKLFENNGVSGEKLEQALSSFTVAAKTRRAKSMTKSYDIQSVPTVIVQGKYRTNATLANGHGNVFKVVDYLSEKIQKEQNQ